MFPNGNHEEAPPGPMLDKPDLSDSHSWTRPMASASEGYLGGRRKRKEKKKHLQLVHGLQRHEAVVAPLRAVLVDPEAVQKRQVQDPFGGWEDPNVHWQHGTFTCRFSGNEGMPIWPLRGIYGA